MVNWKKEKKENLNSLIKRIPTMKEKDFRDLPFIDSPWPTTQKELLEIIKALLNREHDYGTCVYAVAFGAQATFNYIASKLGITGFQSGCADMEVLRRVRWMEHGFRILDYKNLLYPQYRDRFPTYIELIYNNLEMLQKEAKKLLGDKGISPHSNVKKHWEWILGLEKPEA